MERNRFTPRSTAIRQHLLSAGMLVPILALVFLAANWLGGQTQWIKSSSFAWVFFALAVKLVLFLSQRVFQAWGRYVTFHDLVVLCHSASLSSLILVLANFVVGESLRLPYELLILDWAMTILTVGGIQMISRMAAEGTAPRRSTDRQTPVLIVGANEFGEALLRAIRRNANSSYRVVGFVSQEYTSVGKHIAGVPIVGVVEDACRLAKNCHASAVLIADEGLDVGAIRRLIDECNQLEIKVQVVPSYERLLKTPAHFCPRPVSIDDLLRREPVTLNQEQLHRWIDDRVFLVTGSAGSIGSEICRQILAFNPRRLLLVDRWENGQFYLERELRELAPAADIAVLIADVNDADRMANILRSERPNVVIHAAAHKHVPLMEANPGEAVKNIVHATRLLADLCDEHEVDSFVLISTDKAVNPTSVMGACKRVAELYVQALAEMSQCRFVTVRFGNVLDSAGSVVTIFREQIARGGPITITHPEMRRYFMTIPEASGLVIQAGAIGQGGEVFVLDMGEPVRILDLATDMIRLSGLTPGKDIDTKIVGLRSGEKLREELNVVGEHYTATSHPKISVAQSKPRPIFEVRRGIELIFEARDRALKDIFERLRHLVPEYQMPTPPKRAIRRNRAA